MRVPRPRPFLSCVMGLLAAISIAACSDRQPSAPATQPVANTPAAPAQVVAPQPDYHRAKWDPIHFKPAIDKATDQQCLSCHAEVLKPSVRKTSPAGVEAATAKAWYQVASTYQGEQDTFHRRHLETALAKQLMTMRCTTCHQGNDPRDEAPATSASNAGADLTLRKMADPATTCLKCHGQMNWKVMGLPGPWAQSKDAFQNNCLLCHGAIRTSRHAVNYLNGKAIEDAASKPNGGDVCFGCHGGRPWYRTSYPYPRHPWPGMPTDVPDWAKGRPTESELRFISAVVAPASGAEAKQGAQK